MKYFLKAISVSLLVAGGMIGCAGNKPPEVEKKQSLLPPELSENQHARESVAHEFFIRARAQEMTGQYEVALDFYSIAFEYDSTNRELALILGQKFRDRGETDKALKYIQYGLTLPGEPSHSEYRLMADLYLRKGELEKAIIYYKKAIELDDSDRDALYILLTIFEQTADVKGQLEVLDLLIPLMGFPESLVDKQANLYLLQKDYEKLVQVYNRAWSESGDNVFGERLASVYESQGLINNYLAIFQDLRDGDPENPYYQVQVARAYLNMGELDSALAYYKNLLEQFPEKESFLYAHGTILFSMRRFEEAKAQFMELLEKQPENHVYHFYLGSISEMLEDYELAEIEFNKALSLNQEKLDYWAQLGYFFMRRDRFDKAIQLFEKLVQEKSTTAYGWYLLGTSHSRKAEFLSQNNRNEGRLDSLSISSIAELKKSALNHLKKALVLDSSDTRILFELGANYEKSKQEEKAINAFKQLLSLDSNNSMAMNYLGYMLVERDKDLDYAGRLIDKALELEPNNGAYLDSKGWWYYKMKQYDKAKEYIERALTSGANDVTIIEHLALILEKLGESEHAKEQWSLILKLDPYHELANSKLN